MSNLNNKFWEDQLSNRTNAVVIDGDHYRIGDENAPEWSKGMGGDEFRILVHKTKKLIITTNLWHQGTIPEEYLKKLPNDASFAKKIEVQYIET